MELRVNEVTIPEKISFNYEELKAELTEKVAFYETLVYTDDQVKDAKADRATLNKCDRCGGFYDLPFEHGTAIRARVVDVFDDAVETKDLCPDCIEELCNFLDGAQLNDPLRERQIGFKTQVDPYNHLMNRFTRKE